MKDRTLKALPQNIVYRTPMVVTNATDQTKINVQIAGDTAEYSLLNKSGDILAVGDSVIVESTGTNLNNGIISYKFGVSNSAYLPLAGGTLTGLLTVSSSGINLNAVPASTSDATHYYIETALGNLVPKTLANVKSEIVTKAAIESSLTGAITSHTHSYVPLAGGVNITGNIALTEGAAITGAIRKTIYFRTGDCNTITEEWAVIHPDVTNAPVTGYWYIQTILMATGDNKQQIAYRYNGHEVYRRRYDGGWSGWTQVWTGSTDGSGSGLDADLLDGYHASSFPMIVGSSSKTWDAASIGAGLATGTTFTVSGAATTDFVLLTYTSSLSPLIVTQASVESANTVRISLANASSGAINVGSKTWKVMVLR